MTAPLSLVRNGHFFFRPTPFSTPLSSPAPSPFSTPFSSPRAWNSVNHGIEISIYDALFASPTAITGPLGDTGGPTNALEDETVEGKHLSHCGCFWCNREAYLRVHFDRPDDTPDEPDPWPQSPLPLATRSPDQPPFYFSYLPVLDAAPLSREVVQNRFRRRVDPLVGTYFDC